MAVVWIAAASCCMLYYVIITVYAGVRVDGSWVWLLLGSLCLLSARIFQQVKNGFLPLPVEWILAAFWVLLIAVLAALLAGILSHMKDDTMRDLDYVIVLGAQVKGSVPSRSLMKRIRKACWYARQHQTAVLILSGGRGRGEEISEAQCMYRYLREFGIDESRMVLEDASESTYENLVFSDRLTGCSHKLCGLVSNDFHMYRALMIARRCGYTEVYALAAPSDPVLEAHFIMREAMALVYMNLRNAMPKKRTRGVPPSDRKDMK